MLAIARPGPRADLVETHSDDDLDKALATDAEVVGVNTRDLETLDVDVERAMARVRRIPVGRLSVMEDGIATRAMSAAVEAGASAVLVGEALMRADDPG